MRNPETGLTEKIKPNILDLLYFLGILERNSKNFELQFHGNLTQEIIDDFLNKLGEIERSFVDGNSDLRIESEEKISFEDFSFIKEKIFTILQQILQKQLEEVAGNNEEILRILEQLRNFTMIEFHCSIEKENKNPTNGNVAETDNILKMLFNFQEIVKKLGNSVLRKGIDLNVSFQGTYVHSSRVSRYLVEFLKSEQGKKYLLSEIKKFYGFKKEFPDELFLQIIEIGGMLHDLGKILEKISVVVGSSERIYEDQKTNIVNPHIVFGALIFLNTIWPLIEKDLEQVLTKNNLLNEYLKNIKTMIGRMILLHHENYGEKPEIREKPYLGIPSNKLSFLEQLLRIIDSYQAIEGPRPYNSESKKRFLDILNIMGNTIWVFNEEIFKKFEEFLKCKLSQPT